MKLVMRYGKKGKLSLLYVGPNEILQRVGKFEYELTLPSVIASIHLVFYVSMFKNFIVDLEYILYIEGLGIYENLSY